MITAAQQMEGAVEGWIFVVGPGCPKAPGAGEGGQPEDSWLSLSVCGVQLKCLQATGTSSAHEKAFWDPAM